jgi:diacylglycerol kinase (ATP)
MSKKDNIFRSFGYAFSGIVKAFKSEPNFRIHIIAATLSLVAAFFLNFAAYEWLILVFAILLVIILELVNTAIETVVDMVSPRYSLKAKVVKDVSAAAVMIAAFMAILVGIILFLPKILILLHP